MSDAADVCPRRHVASRQKDPGLALTAKALSSNYDR
jgi:hypothetical protein